MFSKKISSDIVFGILGILIVVVSIYLLQRTGKEGFLDYPKECQNLGRPSTDKRIRVYTKGECDVLGGNFAPSGECLRKTGGSFSWDCRALNMQPQNMPAATQTSAVPKATAGATTANPTVANAQSRDILAAKESLKNLKLLADVKPPLKTDLSEFKRMEINKFITEIPANNRLLDDALANRPPQPVAKVTQIRTIAESHLNALKAAKATAGTLHAATAAAAAAAKPTQVACGPGVITLQELRNLKFRVDEEINRLSNLRSSSPTLKQRIDQLAKLSADLGDMISGVERNQLNLDSIPIQPDSAAAFLKALGNDSIALPSLVCPPGATPPSIAASPTIAVYNQMPPPPQQQQEQPPVNPQALQGLLEMAQFLKWDFEIKLEYDPALAQRERIMKRIEAMEKRLLDYSISETPLPKEVYALLLAEIQTLQMMIRPKDGSRSKSLKGSPLARFPSESSRDDGALADMGLSPSGGASRSRGPEYPSAKQLTTAQGGGFGTKKATFPNGEISPDVYIRPGFVMNDDTIARRASASAFDPAAVGGLDYKARAQEICRQIKSGQLGEPADFGCIENPNEVSSSYSWKGNYEMVCNRLGDSWGSWYPAMFGCPKYDPAAKFSGLMK